MGRWRSTAGSWRAVVAERWRRLTVAPSPPADPPSWPLDPARLAGLSVTWPADYRAPEVGKWVDPFRDEFARVVRVARGPVPQPGDRAIEYHVSVGARTFSVGLDFGDYKDELCGPLLERSLVYFKMQFRIGGYPDPRVVPGGYVNASQHIYHYLPALRRARDTAPETSAVYGRFGTRFAADVRSRVVTALKTQSRFPYSGGLSLVRYSEFLNEIAQAGICIDLPGNGDFCYRLVDYFAVGSCVLAARHGTTLPVPLVDREHLVYFADDGSDLLDLCEHYLTRPAERRRLVENSRNYFDRTLHRRQLAGYYLREILNRITPASTGIRPD